MSTDQNPIPPVTRDDSAAHSGDVVAENIAALKSMFPAIVTDGKVDFDVLRQLLGDEVEDGAERYGLNWKGKTRARAFALTPSLGTLLPAKEDSKDWDTTKNIVIEGDNLEVLKLLRKSYAGKVKLIYIDPPYNTGKDFVYPDNYTESLANYEALTGQRGEDGARLTSNKETSGRFHTDWLNMMYPRLMIAKELLRDDGVIAISTADNELEHLLELGGEIFGFSNHLATVSNVTGANQSGEGVTVQKNVEYLILFCRDIDEVGIQRTSAVAETMRALNDAPTPLHTRHDLGYSIYFNPENSEWQPVFDYDPNSVSPDSGESIYKEDKKLVAAGFIPVRPGRRRGRLHRWRWGKETLLERRAEIVFKQKDGEWRPYFQQGGLNPPKNIWNFSGGASDLSSLMGEDDVFSYPKGVPFLREIVALFGANGLTIDFFAGSGTTGHAVMAQNAADNSNRRFLLVQLPEPLDPAKSEQKAAADFCDKLGKPRNIAELTKERLRRAGAEVQAEHPEAKLDTGFRVYKLATSNLKPWQPGEDLAADLVDATSNVLYGRSEDDLLVELLLKTGIDLTLPGEMREIAGRTVHMFGGGTLIVCLADIPAAEARTLGDGIADWLAEVQPPGPTTLFFKDSGFDAGGQRKAEARSMLAATLRQRLGEDAIEKLGAI